MIPAQDQHPPADVLLAFAQGRLDDLKFNAIESHLLHCEVCCRWMNTQDNHTLLSLAREVATLGILQAAPTATGSIALPEVLCDHPRYRVIEQIGSGGMGAVYKAEHRLMHRTVALKVVHPRLLSDEEAIERFEREVRMAGKLSHPNIVASYDADQAGGIHFLVMEFVDGVSLDQQVKALGPIDVRTACDWVCQVLLGLQHSHACGMTHRDIKPANLMITKDGQIKILDFGLSRLSADSLPVRTADASLSAGETRADVILGTPDYVAPEQIVRACDATIQSDLYSLGCTLYFLLAGQAPFASHSTRDKLRAQQQTPLPQLDRIRPDVPKALLSILERMTAKTPAQRFANPSEVLSELQPLLASFDRPREVNQQPAALTRRQWLPRAAMLSVGAVLLVSAWAAFGWPMPAAIGGATSLRVLVMLPRQGLWFPDYQSLQVGAQNTGAELVFAGLTKEASQTLSTSVPGIAVPDVVLHSDIHASAFDAILFIGYDTSDFSPSGPAGEQTRRLINEFQFEKKVVAGLCSGQRVLAQHGALRGKHVAASQSVTHEEIEVEGGKQSNESIVVDGRVVTSDATNDATLLLEAIEKAAKR